MKYAIRGALVAALAAIAGSALAKDAALVIGNADYDHGPRAKSAERDAESVAEALGDAGYEVIAGIDLNRVEMRAAMDQFAAAAADADRIVIYYSGHAMRMQGRTFLAPTDFMPVGPTAVAMDGAPFAGLMALAATKPGASVLFLDAAQLDGFEPSIFAEPGIAEVEAPEGVLIVSAAAPGQAVRRSSWFSSSFARRIADAFLEPGASVMVTASESDAPIWTAGALPEDFALIDAPEPEPEPEPAAAASSGIAQQIELAFWQSTEAAGTAADYQAYLNRYPDGLFAEIAKNRVAQAGGAAVSSPSAPSATTAPASAGREPGPQEVAALREATLGLSRSQRLAVQRDLTELGYDTNGIDGIFGRGTRGALRLWQEAEGLTVTGYLSEGQPETLREAAQDAIDEREAAAAERARMDAEAARQQEEDDWNRARRVNTEASYRRYLQAYPEGEYAREARLILREARERAEEDAWAEAARLDTAAAYSSYLDKFPNGPNAIEAQRRYDNLTANDRGAATTAALQAAEEEAWSEAQSKNNIKGYRDFLEAYPDSRYAEEAESRRAELQTARWQEREDRLRLDRNSWKSVEQRLAFLGFDPGPQDGKINRRTRNAITQYRRSRGLEVHGYLDKKFIEILVNESNQPRQATGGDLLRQLFQQLQD